MTAGAGTLWPCLYCKRSLAVANYRSIHSLVMPLTARACAAHRKGVGTNASVGGIARVAMIAALKEARHCNAITLTKELGETAIEGQGMLDAPPWKWPER